MQPPFLIYRSSAGSGKTYTLALAYLKLALSARGRFKRILGITFTNKATEEMKQRIVKFLTAIACGEDAALAETLCQALAVDADELQRKAQETLSDILHQYSGFSIVTIDSFFHQVIRSFAWEAGLQSTFTIGIDTNTIMEEVIDDLLASLRHDDDTVLKSRLVQYAVERVEEGSTWDVRKDMLKLAKELFKDRFKGFAKRIAELSHDNDSLAAIGSELQAVKYSFEATIKKHCDEVLDSLQAAGLSVDHFKRKGSGPAGLFIKLRKREWEITDGRRAAADNTEAWINKTDSQKARLEQVLSDFLLPKYQKLIHYFDARYTDYRSACEALRYFQTFALLGHISAQLQAYRDEHDVMLISDLPDFLGKVIADSDTPYIYEKVGARFEHYLIDEFQDTSAFQWNNLKPLVKNATDQGQFSMVVGDVKQSIYRFRGGDWRLLQEKVSADIGEDLSAVIPLTTNWRSAAAIVEFNNAFFRKLNDPASSRLFQDHDEASRESLQKILSVFSDAAQQVPAGKVPESGLVEIGLIENEEDKKQEAIRRVIEKAEEFQQQGYAPRDIAILTRKASEGKAIARAFTEYGASPAAKTGTGYDVVSKEALFLTSGHAVRLLVSVIQWLHDESNRIVLANWVSIYLKYVKNEPLEDAERFGATDEWTSVAPPDFVKRVHSLKTLPIYELTEELIRLFDLGRLCTEFTYLLGFQDAVLEFTNNERGDMAAFLTWWEEVRRERAILLTDDNDAIKILTVHKSKGLEFPIVIIPFLDWALDEGEVGNKDNILWCLPADRPPYHKMPVLPLKYGKALKDTYWAAAYHEEKLKNLIDSLNMLYVALTRPVSALVIFTGASRNGGALKTVGDLLISALKDDPLWLNDCHYAKGQLPKATLRKVSVQEYALPDYHSHRWRSKVSLQFNHSAERSTVFDQAATRGIDLHEELKAIITQQELPRFREHQYFGLLQRTVDVLGEFFTEDWTVMTEVPLLLPGGAMKRLDRLNLKPTETVVIDYKTGQERNSHQKQIGEYVALMREAGYPGVRGILFYPETEKTITIT